MKDTYHVVHSITSGAVSSMSELWWAEVGEFLYRSSLSSAVDLDLYINRPRIPTQSP